MVSSNNITKGLASPLRDHSRSQSFKVINLSSDTDVTLSFMEDNIDFKIVSQQFHTKNHKK